MFFSLLKIRIITTKKNTNPITNGETSFPNKKPNFIHILFNGVNILEFIKANTKKMNEIPIEGLSSFFV